MEKEILINRLKAKPDLNLFIVEAIENTTILNSLFEIVLTETSSIKYVCSKIIRLVSEQKPELIYPYFEYITKWLHHKNSFIKWDGILTLSNLSAVDYEDKFGAIYQDYFSLIQDPQMITAANVIGNAWKIVLAKPELESDVTRRLLEVPKIIYSNKGEPSPECNCIMCGKVLECFEHYFDFSGNQAAMIDFAEGQLGSSRKSVAKNAEKFLRHHSGKMDHKIESLNTLYAMDRTSWRDWLTENFEKEKEVWLVFPSKKSGEGSISYNDAVEEALCFGWVDSTVRKLDDNHRIQRFTPRRNGSKYSRANIERLIWLEHQGMLHPKVRSSVLQLIREPYIFPKDIIEFLRSDERAWANYEKFPEEYKRIRVAYIDGARNRPEEFHKRLESFLKKTRENKLVGYGGIDKYFKFENSETKKDLV